LSDRRRENDGLLTGRLNPLFAWISLQVVGHATPRI